MASYPQYRGTDRRRAAEILAPAYRKDRNSTPPRRIPAPALTGEKGPLREVVTRAQAVGHNVTLSFDDYKAILTFPIQADHTAFIRDFYPQASHAARGRCALRSELVKPSY